MLAQLINTAEQTTIHIDAIRLDGGTQPRDGLDAAYVTELAQSLQDGATFPPVAVMHDGQNYWLYDGYHRVAAHRQANILRISATIHQGDQAAAQWESYASNQSHGKRRSQDDKERAIRAALKHPHGANMADSLIAKHLGVSDKTVTKYRELMESSSEIPKIKDRTVQRGGQVYTQNTTNIGANRPPARKTQPAIEEHNAGTIALSSPTADPWAAAWAMLHPTEFPDERRRRLSEAMIPWALAWDDNGRTWRDVVDRNPQHANSPFRQAAETECRRRGLNIEGHHMQDVIRKLFFRLINTNPIMAAPTPEPEAPTAPALVLDGARPLPAWVNGDADTLTSAVSVQPANAPEIPQSPRLPVSQRDDYDSDEWYTPADIISAARQVMGSIALDPASSALAQTVVRADAYLTRADNGLHQPAWLGETIWLNPPYSQTANWVDKLLAEYDKKNFIRQAIVLVNNATETSWFQSLLTHSAIVCLPARRVAFWRHDHANVGARQGQAIFYLGANVAAFIHEFEPFGTILLRIAQ